ncbi:PREDICTED: phthiocerol/phenolphthiocerol synthesis polyketide synthase type I PpsD-like isoform X3 [Acropora digitifera]|uniref:phthiocerol/phenolphthiocerol synthesis polyketide synthase type I PpsD-like isoform X3 n=1 Tax=Acropora digitifera TaxID=70779 RepID=UPI00077ABBB2|nr:PREDICTED: phthiocerol/phenolphthiocerol synthesis polyketide synthase type I PpsD-like isoform X3 [Acropora digitifera]
METLETRDNCEETLLPRSYNALTTRSRSRISCGDLTSGRLISYRILLTYEKAFQKLGFAITRRWVLVLLIWLTFTFAGCLGFLGFNAAQLSSNLFIQHDSQSRKDLIDTSKAFPLLEARREQIILSPKRSQNALSEDCLKEALSVHQTVVSISHYKELCFRYFPTNNTSKERPCVINNPLEFAGANFENLTNLSSILAHERITSKLTLSSGQTFNSSFHEMFSNFQIVYARHPPTSRADAILFTYFIRNSANDDNREIFLFEKQFENEVSALNQRLKFSSISFRTGSATTKAIQSILTPKLMPLWLSAVTIVSLIVIPLLFGSDSVALVETFLLLLSSLVLPLVCAVGLFSMAHVSLYPIAYFIPFLLLGKVSADVVVILREWRRLNYIRSVENRVGSYVARWGILQIFSAFCGAVLFSIPINSSFQIISRFYLTIFLGYALISPASFITMAILMSSEERLFKCLTIWSARSCNKPLFLSKCRFLKGPIMKLLNKLKFACKKAVDMLTSRSGRVISVAFLTFIVTVFALLALQPGSVVSTTTNLYRQDHNFNLFNEAHRKFFGKSSDVSIVFFDDIDYCQRTTQNQLINICKTLGKASNSQADSVCWIAEILQWAKHENVSCSNSEFLPCLTRFLKKPAYAPLQQDIRFEGKKIFATRLHVRMLWNHSFERDRKSLEKLRKDLSVHAPFKVATVSHKFSELDDLLSLEEEVLFVVKAASVVIFVLCLLSSTSFIICTCLTSTFLFLVMETAGIMKAWDISLNHITAITLYCTLFLAFNSSHLMAHSFVYSEEVTIQKRMTTAMRSVSCSVLLAAFLETCGSVSLGFIYPALQTVFFRVVPSVLSLGVIHAIVILPPVIITVFEIIDKFDSLNENKLLHSAVEKMKQEIKLKPLGASQVNIQRNDVSVVGMGCRFPGANSKDLFWDMLEQGKCSIGSFPCNRAQEYKMFLQHYHSKRFVRGRLCAVNGSYLEEIRTFDNQFFDISSQEARGMDPQQRLLLEVVYEAIEDAGATLEDLQKCRTGVFVGAMNLDYGSLVTHSSNFNNIDQFTSTGMTASILANRVSFCFNFTGPSIAVDTACSSSLTALKLAFDSLQNEECEIAIVCAPNIILDHSTQIISSMAGLLAPDGRCKSFDASGDGYGRGEGIAAVILKQSHAALSDRDDEYCHIIACGMNSDGQNAVPMTAPSSKMQAELSKVVLERAGVSAEDISYIEAHGTGTAIGDEVEVTSIAETYSRGTASLKRELRIGSVKSNLNHTEATSGLAGLIKVALMIKKRRMVPTVNVQTLNPKLKLRERGLAVQKITEIWNVENGKPRIAAVNSFGYGGSNVHAILQEVPLKETSEGSQSECLNHVLTLSARSQEVLKEMAKLYSKWLCERAPEMDGSFLPNLCYSLSQRRSHFQHRLALVFGTISEACQSLQEYASDSMGWDKCVCYGEKKSSDVRIVFLFGGQGSQWYAMGRQLITYEPVFRKAILTVSNLVRDLGGSLSLMEELLVQEDKSRISENSISQPATFAVQYATAQLLFSWNIFPSAVIGHSLGEIAAACVADIITVKEAVNIVLTRSTLQDQCHANGSMAALGMSETEAQELIEDLRLDASLNIAAVNDGESVTVSGDSQSVETLGRHLAMHSRDTFWRVLGTRKAFHSPHMEVIKKPFLKVMKRVKIKPQLSKIPMYSTVDGEIVSAVQLNEDYWWRNIRSPVLFQQAMKNLLKDGYKLIAEISSQPILVHNITQIAKQENLKFEDMPIVLTTLPRKRVPLDEQHKIFLLNTVCRLFTLGFPIDWTCVQGNPFAKFIRLPNYPWMKSSFWFREHQPASTISPLSIAESNKNETHPYLETMKMTDLYSGLWCWECDIDLHHFPHLKDHAIVQGVVVMPAAAYLEMALAMAKNYFVDVEGLQLSDVKLFRLLTLPETQVRRLRLRIQKGSSIQEAKFDITSVHDGVSEIGLSSGRVSIDLLGKQEEHGALTGVGAFVQEKITEMTRMSMDSFREIRKKYGLNHGPNFSIIKDAWMRDNEGMALIDISDSNEILSEIGRYVIHPSILDACLQSCLIPGRRSAAQAKLAVPVSFQTITLSGAALSNQLYCHVTEYENTLGKFDITLMSPSGNVVMTMHEIRADDPTSSLQELPFGEIAYEVEWKEDILPRKSEISPKMTCIVLSDSSIFSRNLVSELEKYDISVTTLQLPNACYFDCEAEKMVREVLPSNDECSLTLVNLWPLEVSLVPDEYEFIEQIEGLAFCSSAFVLKLLSQKREMRSRLFLVTERTQMMHVHDTGLDKAAKIPWSSTVWGLKRSVVLEDATMKVTMVDLSNKDDQREIESLVNEILCDNVEDELIFQGGKRFINRILRSRNHQWGSKRTTEKDCSLYLSTIPLTRTLCLREQGFTLPQPTEVTIDASHCWSLSKSLCALAKSGGCVFISGKVAHLPAHSENGFKTGDQVCGVIPSGRVARFISINEKNVFLKPASLTLEHASCIPACLAIACYAIEKAASGEENQKLLILQANIHPGPAAVALATAMGHRITCTISNTCKMYSANLLVKLGARDVRSQVLQKDDSGDQFDAIILFSLPFPNSFQKSVRRLKKGGRIIVLSCQLDGEVVFSSNKHVEYVRTDISDILRSPSGFEKLALRSLHMLERKGRLEELLDISLESADLLSSIRTVNSLKDEAKSGRNEVNQFSGISLSIQSLAAVSKEGALQDILVLPQGLDDCGLRENRTYLVAGGTRGFGLEVACWMAENGAKTIALISRSKPSDVTLQRLSEIEQRTGAKTHIFQVDISSEKKMTAFKVDQLQSLPSLAGIVHTAMVLRDQPLKDLSFEGFSDVMGPKVKGSFLLHQMSLEMDLDFFVMFSSMASIFGSAQQVSYSACNAFQDSLAEYRRHVLGLPGLAINWGPISGAGVMEREVKIAKLMTAVGLGFVDAKEGILFYAAGHNSLKNGQRHQRQTQWENCRLPTWQ